MLLELFVNSLQEHVRLYITESLKECCRPENFPAIVQQHWEKCLFTTYFVTTIAIVYFGYSNVFEPQCTFVATQLSKQIYSSEEEQAVIASRIVFISGLFAARKVHDICHHFYGASQNVIRDRIG